MIHPYNSVRECPKCGQKFYYYHGFPNTLINVSVKYMSRCVFDPPDTPDTLIKTCDTCSFSWYEYPKDHKE